MVPSFDNGNTKITALMLNKLNWTAGNKVQVSECSLEDDVMADSHGVALGIS